MRRFFGLLFFLLSLQMAIIFQPQYGVPVIGPAFYASQMFQATMVWFCGEVLWRTVVTSAVIVTILVVLSLVFFRGRYVGTLLTFLSIRVLSYFWGEAFLQFCVIIFTILNTLMLIFGIIMASPAKYVPYRVTGTRMERLELRIWNWMEGSWPWRFGTWMVNTINRLLRYRPRLRTNIAGRYRRAKWIAALICTLGLPIGMVHMYGSFFDVTAYPGWMTVVSWGLSLVTYLATALLYLL